MNSKKILDIYAQLGKEEYERYVPQGWENSLLCYKYCLKRDPENIDYVADVIQSYLSLQKYAKFNNIPTGDKYVNEIEELLNKAQNYATTHPKLMAIIINFYYVYNDLEGSKEIFNSIKKKKEMEIHFQFILMKIKIEKICNINEILSKNIKKNFSKSEISHIYYLVADNLLANKEFEKALKLFNISLEYKNDNAFSLNKIGVCYYELGKYITSIEYFKKALNIIPNLVRVYINLSKVKVYLEQYKEAIKILKKVIKINPFSYVAYNHLGVIYYKKKMYLHSIKAYNKAINLNKCYAMAYNNLGISFEQIEGFEDSEKYYRKAIECNPSYYQAYNNLGALLNNLGRTQEAISCYKRALHINPKYKNAYLNLEKAYDKLESNEEVKSPPQLPFR